jgi:hypothetical protein
MFIVMFAIVLSACAKATTQPDNETINPGHKIGDFLITEGDSEDINYLWSSIVKNKVVTQSRIHVR